MKGCRQPMSQQVEEYKRFVAELAGPHIWLLTADNLHQQAKALYALRGRSSMIHIDPVRNVTTHDGVNKSVFLLAGFALENALKAYLVFEHPEWISNGRLSRNLRLHSLTGLQGQSNRVPYKRKMTWVLAEFEDGLESWARYPCALTLEETTAEKAVRHDLWTCYLRLMRAYVSRLRGLLSKQVWKGPHGFSGRVEYGGQFFDALAPIPRATRRRISP
jgi:hypothetical protein